MAILKRVLLLVIFGALAIGAIGCNEEEKEKKRIAKQEAALEQRVKNSVKTELIRIIFDYEQDFRKADAMYKGKDIYIKARVDEVYEDSNTAFIVFRTANTLVQVYFDESQYEKFRKLRWGSQVELVGTCDGLTGYIIVIKDSYFVK